MSVIPLLLLADGRMLRGGPEDAGGVRAAVAAGRVRDAASLHAFLLGRLATCGLTSAAFAAAAALDLAGGIVVSGGGRLEASALAELDAEFEARVPAPAQRMHSRAAGRHVIEAVRAGWPSPVLDAVSLVHPEGPHRPVAFGAAATVAGLDAPSVAAATAHAEVTTAAAQAAQLLGLDRDDVTRVLAQLASAVEDVAAAAFKVARGPVEDLPALWAPLLSVGSTLAAAAHLDSFGDMAGHTAAPADDAFMTGATTRGSEPARRPESAHDARRLDGGAGPEPGKGPKKAGRHPGAQVGAAG